MLRRNVWMAEKSVMAKSVKSNQKKKAVPTTEYQSSPVDVQTMASQKVFDAIPLAILSVDWNGQIPYMNRAAKSLLGEPEPRLELEDWARTVGLYLGDGSGPWPGQELALLRGVRGG